MFQINDTVLYGAEGVFKVQDITEMDFAGEAREYYVLKSLYNETSTVFVPTDKEALLAKMRKILSKEEILDMIRSMPEEDLIWIEEESERVKAYKEILMKGDHREIVKLIRTLYLHGRDLKEMGKNLHKVDERFLKDAERMLYDEFAYVLDIKPNEVLTFIQEQIELN